MMGRDGPGYNISADGQRIYHGGGCDRVNLDRGGSPNPEGSITIALHWVDKLKR